MAAKRDTNEFVGVRLSRHTLRGLDDFTKKVLRKPGLLLALSDDGKFSRSHAIRVVLNDTLERIRRTGVL